MFLKSGIMENVFLNNTEAQLIDAKNKIKELEEKIAELENQLEDKQYTIDSIENNMSSHYVENWSVTDSDGNVGEFSGNIRWIKGGGLLFYEDGTNFEGDWDLNGEIMDGVLFDTDSGDVITKWDCGLEVEEDQDNNN